MLTFELIVIAVCLPLGLITDWRERNELFAHFRPFRSVFTKNFYGLSALCYWLVMVDSIGLNPLYSSENQILGAVALFGTPVVAWLLIEFLRFMMFKIYSKNKKEE